MSEKPPALLVFAPALHRGLVTPERRERLAARCELLSNEPLAGFDDAAAAPLLDRVEVLVTSWGCARLDSAALEPRLGHEPPPPAAATARGPAPRHGVECR
jgi:hypothetical protein